VEFQNQTNNRPRHFAPLWSISNLYTTMCTTWESFWAIVIKFCPCYFCLAAFCLYRGLSMWCNSAPRTSENWPSNHGHIFMNTFTHTNYYTSLITFLVMFSHKLMFALLSELQYWRHQGHLKRTNNQWHCSSFVLRRVKKEFKQQSRTRKLGES
jgi:hypothetical protein